MKTSLTQMDKWALDAARGLGQTTVVEGRVVHGKGSKIPSIEQYNIAVKAGVLSGSPIQPLVAP